MPRSYASDLLVDGIDLAAERSSPSYAPRTHRRTDLFMIVVAAVATAGVLVNAFMFQEGRREAAVTPPRPASTDARPAVPVPAAPEAPAPAHLQATPDVAATSPMESAAGTDAAVSLAAPAAPLPPTKPPAPKPVAKVDTSAIGALSGQAGGPASTMPASLSAPVRPPADVAVSARLVEIQKALARLGYGPVRIDGRASPETQQAIENFERDRRLPVTGQVSDRLVRELNAVAGFSIQ